MQPLSFSLHQAEFVSHKSLCPRSKLRDLNNTGRFKFVHEKKERHASDVGEFLEAQLEHKLDVSPGPGDYDVCSYGEHKKLGIILAKHTPYNTVKQPVPGPGRYEIRATNSMSKFKASPNVIFAPPRVERFLQKTKVLTPGPGDYNTENAKKGFLSNFSSSQIFSISKTRRSEIGDEKAKTPGPGDYNTLPIKRKHKSVSRFKFVHGFPS